MSDDSIITNRCFMKIIRTFLFFLFSFQLQAQMFKLPKYYMPIGLNVGGGGKVIGCEASFIFAGDGFGHGAFKIPNPLS